MALIGIHNLKVGYRTQRGLVQALDNVTFVVEPGQSVGIIGESGCGKSTLANTILRVLPRNAEISAGEITFKGQNILSASEAKMRDVRWQEIALIPQASMDALNPVYRVGVQFEEILTVRGGRDKRAAKRRATDLAGLVGLPTVSLSRYPHELSGGMKQRAAIAMALALEPSVLIADEPVTALDVIVQRQILDVLKSLQRVLSLTVILITHDVSVVAETTDKVIVMYAGQVIEVATTRAFFGTACHPYSLGLRHAFPSLKQQDTDLIAIEGHPPDLLAPSPFCRFAPRCSFEEQRCHEIEPKLQPVNPDHESACLRVDEIETLRTRAENPEAWATKTTQEASMPGSLLPKHDLDVEHKNGVLIEVTRLTKKYELAPGLRTVLSRRGPRFVQALSDVSLKILRGESLGVAGESGCGKTTLGKLLLKILEPTSGSIRFDEQDLSQFSKAESKVFRRRAQLMFQNPFEALNPRFNILQSLLEPLAIQGLGDRQEQKQRVRQMLQAVRLDPAHSFLDKYPHELSGGQLQRAMLARALILGPDFLVADEPVSMLDISVRAGILNTMQALGRDMGLTTVYISHDLSLLRYTCDRIAIMYLGNLVEIGPVHEVIAEPKQPYTQALIAAVPTPELKSARPQLRSLVGIPASSDSPTGCPFHPRCPEAQPECREVFPPEVAIGENHKVKCHLYAV